MQNSSAAAGLTLLLQLLAHCHCRGCLDMCPFSSTMFVGINYEGGFLFSGTFAFTRIFLKFRYSEKATKFGKNLPLKGQIKPKAVWALRRFSQKTNERICFVCHEKQKSKQNKFVHSFFGRIYGVPICFRFYLTFSASKVATKKRSL